MTWLDILAPAFVVAVGGVAFAVLPRFLRMLDERNARRGVW